MNNIRFCTAGSSPALTFARNQLAAWGYAFADHPRDGATHLLLPVPSLDDKGVIRGGPTLDALLRQLPQDLIILGGGLPSLPLVAVDFLRDPYYLWENAAITARCATQILQREHLPAGSPVLILGWGRIGKHLAGQLCRSHRVTVAARNPAHRAEIRENGFHSLAYPLEDIGSFQAIINTVPAPVLTENAPGPDTILLDLASVAGMEGNRVLWERGLPGRMAPEASGNLIAKTALRYALNKE